MKNKIKQFYARHQVGVIITAAGIYAAGATYLTVKNIVEGKDILAVSRKVYDDGAMDVAVTLKNGTVQFWSWLPEAK